MHILRCLLLISVLIVGFETGQDASSVDISIIRECKSLQNCTFYKGLLEANIPGVRMNTIANELKKQKCGWAGEQEPRGKS